MRNGSNDNPLNESSIVVPTCRRKKSNLANQMQDCWGCVPMAFPKYQTTIGEFLKMHRNLLVLSADNVSSTKCPCAKAVKTIDTYRQ